MERSRPLITEIKKSGINGEGIAYVQGVPLFVEGALIHETVECLITERYPRYMKGRLLKVIKANEYRKEPPCEYQGRCGACPLMIAEPVLQKNMKTELVKQSLMKYIGRFDFRLIKSFNENPSPYAYRNQFKYPIRNENGKLITGFYQENSRDFVKIDHCMVHEAELETMKNEVMDILNKYRIPVYKHPSSQGLRYLVARILGQKIQLTLVTGTYRFPEACLDELRKCKQIHSLYQSINPDKRAIDIFGDQIIHLGKAEHLSFELEGLKLFVYPRAFFQLNTLQASALYQRVKSYIEPSMHVVDAYCGTGMMSCLLAQKAKTVIGIERVEDAIKSAELNKIENKFDHLSFVLGDSAKVLGRMKQKIDCLVIDPPRSGIDSKMLEAVKQKKIPKLIYVSCNPSTLAKNLSELSDIYTIEGIHLYDFFTHTPLVECITVLSLKGK